MEVEKRNTILTFKIQNHKANIHTIKKYNKFHEQITPLFNKLKGFSFYKFMEELKKRHNNSFKIAIIGEFSTGKTSFINALLGNKTLPTSSAATTSTIFEIIDKPFSEFHLEIFSKNKSAFQKNFNSPETLKAFLKTIKGKDITKIKIKTNFNWNNTKILADLKIYDTPGLNYVNEKRHKELTFNLLKKNNFDLIILFTDYTNLFDKEQEQKTLKQLLQQNNKETERILVINKIDKYEEEDDPLTFQLEERFKNLSNKFQLNDIFFVSANPRYKYKLSQIRLPSLIYKEHPNNDIDKLNGIFYIKTLIQARIIKKYLEKTKKAILNELRETKNTILEIENLLLKNKKIQPLLTEKRLKPQPASIIKQYNPQEDLIEFLINFLEPKGGYDGKS